MCRRLPLEPLRLQLVPQLTRLLLLLCNWECLRRRLRPRVRVSRCTCLPARAHTSLPSSFPSPSGLLLEAGVHARWPMGGHSQAPASSGGSSGRPEYTAGIRSLLRALRAPEAAALRVRLLMRHAATPASEVARWAPDAFAAAVAAAAQAATVGAASPSSTARPALPPVPAVTTTAPPDAAPAAAPPAAAPASGGGSLLSGVLSRLKAAARDGGAAPPATVGGLPAPLPLPPPFASAGLQRPPPPALPLPTFRPAGSVDASGGGFVVPSAPVSEEAAAALAGYGGDEAAAGGAAASPLHATAALVEPRFPGVPEGASKHPAPIHSKKRPRSSGGRSSSASAPAPAAAAAAARPALSSEQRARLPQPLRFLADLAAPDAPLRRTALASKDAGATAHCLAVRIATPPAPAVPASGVGPARVSLGSAPPVLPLSLTLSGRMAAARFLEHIRSIHTSSTSRALAVFILTPALPADAAGAGDDAAARVGAGAWPGLLESGGNDGGGANDEAFAAVLSALFLLG